jgi:hypothetical protein
MKRGGRPASPLLRIKKDYVLKIDGLVKSHHNRWLCKKPKFKARESRGVRRTCSTPQRQRDEAQRRNWAFYEAIDIATLREAHEPAD